MIHGRRGKRQIIEESWGPGLCWRARNLLKELLLNLGVHNYKIFSSSFLG
jgi:hypothetical protein